MDIDIFFEAVQKRIGDLANSMPDTRDECLSDLMLHIQCQDWIEVAAYCYYASTYED